MSDADDLDLEMERAKALANARARSARGEDDVDAIRAQRRAAVEGERAAAAAAAQDRPATAALAGVGQGSSLGFADELEGFFKAAYSTGAGLTAAALRTPAGRQMLRESVAGAESLDDATLDAVAAAAESKTLHLAGLRPGGSAYKQGRDEARARNTSLGASNPNAMGAGEFVGSLAVPIPGGATGAAAGRLTAGGVRALQGLGIGGAYAAGKSEEDVGTSGFAGDVGKGAAFGAVATPILGAGLDKAGAVLGPALRARAEMSAMRAAGLTAGIGSKAKALGMTTESDIARLGREALDMDLVRFGRTASDVLRRTDDAFDAYAAMKRGAIDAADSAAGITGYDFPRSAGAMRAALIPEYGANPTTTAASGKARRFAEDVEGYGTGGFAAAEAQRRAIGNDIPWAAPATGASTALRVQQQRSAYLALRDDIERQVRETAGEQAGDELATANRRMAALSDVKSLSRNEALREPARGVGLINSLAGVGVTGAVTAATSPTVGLIAGAGTAILGRALSPRVPSMAAVTQEQLSRALPSLATNPVMRQALTMRINRPSAPAAQTEPDEDTATRAFLEGN